MVNEDGLTSREHVYAGGDAVTGAATVILARLPQQRNGLLAALLVGVRVVVDDRAVDLTEVAALGGADAVGHQPLRRDKRWIRHGLHHRRAVDVAMLMACRRPSRPCWWPSG